jgi:hypothetical protein
MRRTVDVSADANGAVLAHPVDDTRGQLTLETVFDPGGGLDVVVYDAVEAL